MVVSRRCLACSSPLVPGLLRQFELVQGSSPLSRRFSSQSGLVSAVRRCVDDCGGLANVRDVVALATWLLSSVSFPNVLGPSGFSVEYTSSAFCFESSLRLLGMLGDCWPSPVSSDKSRSGNRFSLGSDGFRWLRWLEDDCTLDFRVEKLLDGSLVPAILVDSAQRFGPRRSNHLQKGRRTSPGAHLHANVGRLILYTEAQSRTMLCLSV